MDIDHLYELIKESNLTLIGYTSRYEGLKDAFISKLNPYVIDEVDESFSLQSYLRDAKLESVLSNTSLDIIGKKSNYIVVDLASIKSNTLPESKGIFDRPKYTKNLSENLRFESIKFGIIPIMTSFMYKTVDSSESLVFMGGSGPMHASDLVIRFDEKGLSVIKNRMGENFEIPYNKLKFSLYI